MSWEHALAARHADVDPTARHVLMVIATHANRAGRAWPSMDTIAKETGRGVSTVKRAVRRIEAAGVIDIIHRSGTSCEFVFPQIPHPGHPVPNPGHPVFNPGHCDTQRTKKNEEERAGPGRSTTWRPAGDTQPTGPVDVRALLAGVKQSLLRRGDIPDGPP